MPGRAQWEVLGEPVAGAVVIKVVGVLLLIAGCGVELTDTTPGAHGNCGPTDSDVTLFKPINDDVLSLCWSCHSNATNPIAKTPTFINSAFSLEDVKKNLCTTYRFGQQDSGKKIVEFPQTSQHLDQSNKKSPPGAQFTASELSDLIDWVNQYKTPSDR